MRVRLRREMDMGDLRLGNGSMHHGARGGIGGFLCGRVGGREVVRLRWIEGEQW